MGRPASALEVQAQRAPGTNAACEGNLPGIIVDPESELEGPGSGPACLL